MDNRSDEQRRNNGGTTWLTRDEVTFIQHLGTFTERGIKMLRLTLLQRYLDGATRRQDWGKIDKAAVIREAEKLLQVKQRKASREKAA